MGTSPLDTVIINQLGISVGIISSGTHFLFKKRTVMKKILLILLILPCISLAQLDSLDKGLNAEEFDLLLHELAVGKWEHIHSVYPSGNTDVYYKEFLLYRDSIWQCDYILTGDTTRSYGYWYVKDTSIFLYTAIDTLVLLGDVVKIDYIDHNKMFLRKIWGIDAARKTSYYERTR